MTKQLILDGASLTSLDVYKVAHAKKGEYELKLSDESIKKILKSNDFVIGKSKSDKAIYGINTGFGALSSMKIEEENLEQLQLNLIRSHCTGVGPNFDRETTRAIMLLRANCLTSGYSGVSIGAINLLLDFINEDVNPLVPKKGSVGASGDLAPLAHIALCLIGEGQVLFNGKEISSEFALHEIKRKAITLGPKDGLALINGTAVMAALGCIGIHRAINIAKIADIAGALTLDGVQGTTVAFSRRISELKPHKGQLDVCDNLAALLKGSGIVDSHEDCGKVQDPYSLRCIPQVHGACRMTIKHFELLLDVEVNSVTDNPLVFPDEDLIISGGNFHGEAMALGMDYMTMGLSEFGNISERRIEKMMNPTFSDLPPFLVEKSGLNSGLMIAHVTAAALASENKALCTPASVDSIPTSTDKEDHVSMGVTSGRMLIELIDNLYYILAIELLCSSQALDFQRPKKSSKALENVHALIRKHVPKITVDRVFQPDIYNIESLLRSGELVSVAEEATGELF